MSDIWVISDTHFNHANILNFTDSTTGELIRGARFSSVKEMDEHMIEQWNSTVKPGDKVYHLGDVMFGDKEYFQKLWPKLHGQKRLIVGNHDDIKYLSSGGFFSKVHMWRMFPEFGLLFTHVPVHPSNLKRNWIKREDYNFFQYWWRRYQSRNETMLNVHGHIHQNPSPEGPYRNMSVEAINYTPVNIEELRIR
jgi:calcineurin-like phosphoesterase family protein